MEKELERAHNGNTRKELIIAEMKLKVDGLRIEEANMRTKIHKTSELIKSFNRDFYQLTQLIQEPRALKDAVKELNKKYGTHKVKIVPVDQDLKKEITRQREYLERNVEGLQRKLAKDTTAYHKSHLAIMQENVILINELNELRRELKVMKLNAHRGPQFKSEDSASMAKEIEAMRARINEMQLQMGREQDQVKQLEMMLGNREGHGEGTKVESECSHRNVHEMVNTSNALKLDDLGPAGPQPQSGQANADDTISEKSMAYTEVIGGAERGIEEQEVLTQGQIHEGRTSSAKKAVEMPSAAELDKKGDVDSQAYDTLSRVHLDGNLLLDMSAAEGASPPSLFEDKAAKTLVEADTPPSLTDTTVPRASVQDTHESMSQGSDPAQLLSDTGASALRISGEDTRKSMVQGTDPPRPRMSDIDTMAPRSSVQDTLKSMAQGADSQAPVKSDVVPMVQRTSVKDTRKSSVEGAGASEALKPDTETKAPRASVKEDQ